MSLNNTLRASVLAALIAIGSTVSSEASTANNPLLSAVQGLVLESMAMVKTVAQSGIEALGYVIRSP
ncbi:MAG: hypothetical protein AB8B82_16320 [Roseovarius sp.]